MSSSIPGTNVPPVSFPGIASGIDYNSIITKLTSLTLSQNVSLNAQIATLNAANTELITINGLVNAVQQSLGALSNPNIFNAYSATSSNTSEGTATVPTGASPLSGTYTITNSTQATATSIANNPAAGHSIYDPVGGTPSWQVPLAKSYAAVTPSNGNSASGNGTVTIDGVTITYNVNVDSVQSLLSKINSQVGVADAGFSATLNAQGEVVFNSTDKPITLGASTDSGNILQVFKLTTAQVNNTATSGSVTSTSDIGGINQATTFSSTTNAGYNTPVTGGFFTINGVQISISTTGDNTASVIARINSSNAGVVANYDATTNKISLSATATGPQNIVVGSASDSSNFLTAVGLKGAGATTQVGSQASVTVTNPAGATTTAYSNSNQVTNAIPGVTLSLQQFTTPYTITVGSDSTQFVGAVNTFISAYNTAITEINNATLPPEVISSQPGSTTTPTSASVGGGVLWNNSDILNIKDQLTNLASGFLGNQQGSYNSLASIGLQLSSSFQVLQTANNGATNIDPTQPVTTQTLQGTDGTFQPLTATDSITGVSLQQELTTAFSTNPSAVQALFNDSTTGLVNVLGNYLGQVTGLPTLLTNGIIGQLPAGGVAIIQGFENSNTDSITTIGEQITQITDNANQQADSLRTQFTATEATLAGYQALQQQLSGFFKSSGG